MTIISDNMYTNPVSFIYYSAGNTIISPSIQQDAVLR